MLIGAYVVPPRPAVALAALLLVSDRAGPSCGTSAPAHARWSRATDSDEPRRDAELAEDSWGVLLINLFLISTTNK